MYYVIVCPECETVGVVDGKPKTTKCGGCGKSNKFKKLRKLYKAENKEEARRARGAIIADMKGESDRYEELLQEGVFDEISESIDSQEFAVEMGANKSELEKVDEKNTNTSKSIDEIIELAFENLEQPTDDKVYDYCSKHTEKMEKVKKKLKAMKRDGEIIEKKDGSLRYIG